MSAIRQEQPSDNASGHAISRLLSEALDMDHGSSRLVLQRLLRTARERVGMDYAFISEFTGGRRLFRHVNNAHGMELIGEGDSDPEDAGYCKRIVRGELPELIRNAQELEACRDIPATHAIGIGAHLSTPIRLSDGTVFGTFCCFSTRPDYDLSERDLGMLHALAGIAGDFLERDVSRLRERERKRQQILSELPDRIPLACNTTAASVVNGTVGEALESAPLDRIVLEITEHAVIEDYNALDHALHDLRQAGLRIAVDDAGAGYASLRHILKLRPEIIKLDMSLTRDIDRDIARRSLAGAMVRFAHEIGGHLVAEGVETRTELETLAELGIDCVQGFHLHKPMTLEQVTRLAS